MVSWDFSPKSQVTEKTLGGGGGVGGGGGGGWGGSISYAWDLLQLAIDLYTLHMHAVPTSQGAVQCEQGLSITSHCMCLVCVCMCSHLTLISAH